MSIVSYLWGVAVLAGSVWALALGTGAVVRTGFPGWRGPLRLLAQIALGLCWVYALCYVLGAVGLFRPVPLFGLVDGGALLAWLRLRGVASDPGEPERRHDRRLPATAWLAGLGAALVGAAWLPGTAHAYRYGILEPDSLWYHGHFSARFVQTGWITRINPVGVDALVPFHLANRELLDAVIDLPWHRDLVLPVTNLVYLALLLLAGWCIGARWERGPVAMLAATVVAAPPVMILSHPGSLKNDLLGMALLLAAVALFVHSEGRTPAVALAGATLGLAAGTKSNLLVVVVGLVGAGALMLVRGAPVGPRTGAGSGTTPAARWLAALTWSGTTALFGGYWYVRNWVRAGNPVPWLDVHLGPLHLSQVDPGDGTKGYTGQTLLHHFGEPGFIGAVIRPGLRFAFGDMWWWWAALLAFSLGLAIAGRARWLWAMAAVGTLGMLGHLVTPLSLVVPADNPGAAFNFAFNTRYALGAMALILVAGACATRTPGLELGFAAAAVAVIVSGLFPTDLSIGVSHDGEAGDAPLALALGGVVLVLVAAAFVWPRWRPRAARPVRLAALPVATVVLAVLALPVLDRYLEQRYATPMPKLASLLWPTTSRLERARIGIATDPKPYPDEGDDLSNRVAYIGVPTEGGVLRNVKDCEEWGRTVRALRLTHVALAPEPFVVLLSEDTLEAWTLAIPGTRVVRRSGDQVLISVPPEPAPTPDGRCPAR